VESILGMIKDNVGGLFIPLIVMLLMVTPVIIIKFVASRWKKVPPNQVGIFFGRKHKTSDGKEVGFRILTGGGGIQMPLVESYAVLSIAPFQVTIDEEGVPNKDNVKLTVKGVATVQISDNLEDLYQAVRCFLGMDERQIREFVANIMKGHLRSIIGTLPIDSLLREREAFNKRMVQESEAELKGIGLNVLNLVIQDIDDKEGYIEALGKRAVAETKAEAEIKVAEATRQQTIAVSNARREAAGIEAQNAAAIAEAEKDRDIRRSTAKAAAAQEQAKAEKALDIALANEERTLKVAQAQRDAAEKTAQIQVAEEEGKRVQKHLEATVIRQAEADKQRAIIEAEAAKQKQILEAQAFAAANVETAKAEKEAMELRGLGEAAKTQAVLEAQAKGEAAKKKEALLAEAEGTRELADALAKMSSDARFIIILDKMPPLMTSGGDALAKVAKAVFESVAAPLAQIDKIQLVDIGGSGRGVNQLSTMVPDVVFNLLLRSQALGLDMTSVLKKFGINPDQLMSMINANPAPALEAVDAPQSDPSKSDGQDMSVTPAQ
jgi:flotillin